MQINYKTFKRDAIRIYKAINSTNLQKIFFTIKSKLFWLLIGLLIIYFLNIVKNNQILQQK